MLKSCAVAGADAGAAAAPRRGGVARREAGPARCERPARVAACVHLLPAYGDVHCCTQWAIVLGSLVAEITDKPGPECTICSVVPNNGKYTCVICRIVLFLSTTRYKLLLVQYIRRRRAVSRTYLHLHILCFMSK